MSQTNQTIAVLGTGCPSCKKLFELTTEAVRDLGLSTEVAYVTDIQQIIGMGIMQTPVLAINGVPVMTGMTNDIEKVKALITAGVPAQTPPTQEASPAPTCGCGGAC